jgi:hypothetical protein
LITSGPVDSIVRHSFCIAARVDSIDGDLIRN